MYSYMEPMSGQPLRLIVNYNFESLPKEYAVVVFFFFQSPVKFETYLAEITRSKNAILCVGCTSGVPTDGDLN